MQPTIAVLCSRAKSPGQKEKTSEADEASAFNSQQHTDFGHRKWSSQCGVVSGFSVWSASRFWEPHWQNHDIQGRQRISHQCVSAKQKLNAESSTTAELAGVDLFGEDNSKKLNEEMKIIFHRTAAQGLFVCKRARPDTQPTMAALCTRVKSPGHKDWNKLV